MRTCWENGWGEPRNCLSICWRTSAAATCESVCICLIFSVRSPRALIASRLISWGSAALRQLVELLEVRRQVRVCQRPDSRLGLFRRLPDLGLGLLEPPGPSSAGAWRSLRKPSRSCLGQQKDHRDGHRPRAGAIHPTARQPDREVPRQIGVLHHTQRLGPGRPGEGVVGVGQGQRRADPFAEPKPLVEQQGRLHPGRQPENPEKQNHNSRNTPERPNRPRRQELHRQEPLRQNRQSSDSPRPQPGLVPSGAAADSRHNGSERPGFSSGTLSARTSRLTLNPYKSTS